ncbi:adenylate cyclase type 2 isoform X2 [Onthophagus taurus]|nr:adenylate cyclase type 2-like [Onthophagus taurus]
MSTFLILLFAFSLTHFSIVLGINMGKDSLNEVILDLVVYIFVTISSVVILYLSEKLVKKRPTLLCSITVVVFIIFFFMNVAIPTFHNIKLLIKGDSSISFKPAYNTLFILSCYVFFNIVSNTKAAILGLLMSTFYIALGVLYNWESIQERPVTVVCDIIYLLCINGFGMYFRLVTEIMKRISLLDRRDLVESTLKLEFEKEQEEQLMASIIPVHAIAKIKQNAEEKVKTIRDAGEYRDISVWKQLDIQQHANVTILYADIVNYTRMTTTLKSLELVETLNELFGRFDDASDELKVLRVKFLGDCYYCVAGLEPDKIADHADACVNLGLRMIKIIQEVKKKTLLPIDMRIGIHTGDIQSGVIGDRKWQFDIWSKDVSIANRMETTGKPGKVHITKQTKDQLRQNYIIEPSDAGQKDEILAQNNIETYIISPEEEILKDHPLIENLRQNSSTANGIVSRGSDVYSLNETRSTTRRESRYIPHARRPSGNPHFAGLNGRVSGRRRTPRDVSRRTAFMDSNIKRYSERLERTNKTIEDSIDDLSFTKYDQYFKTKHINPLTMTFNDCNKEMNFIRHPDHIFKYYIIGILLVMTCIVIIQNINRPDLNRPIGYTLLVVLLLIVPITWSTCNFDYSQKLPKLQIFFDWFRELSEKIVQSVIFRTILYIVIWLASTGTVIYDMLGCEYFDGNSSNTTKLIRSVLYLGRSDIDTNNGEYCMDPWHMTETISLAIIVNFTFLRVHMLLKLISAISVTLLYSLLLIRFDEKYFKSSEIYNIGITSSTAHILHVVFLSFALHCIDRQTDFMTRLDEMLNVEQVEKEQEEKALKTANALLINNILPIHVAQHYLSMSHEAGTLYYEEYSATKPVAVMFAAIIYQSSDSTDKTFLTCMNNRIVDFDQILMQKYEHQIEKIKIANWTYMAACGLDVGRRDSFSQVNLTPTGRRDHFVVLTLLEFAAKILKDPHDSFVKSFDLRIGVSHGEVTAGVVGSRKPLYDIWGDAVNMASRMESTGVVGRIQVTENTAMIAQSLGIACEYRGRIRVKGRDTEIPTYFIQVDDNGKLVKS